MIQHQRNPLRRIKSLIVLGLLASPLAIRAEEPIRFNRDIRPILTENCFACHGPDSASRKADLRLDRRADAIAADAFVPGNVEESELVRRLHLDDPKEGMPPKASNKSLTAEQKELLKRWIAEGAVYEPHWSLIAPKQVASPEVKDAGWVRNPIDQFVMAELDRRGLKPAPEADRRSIARRLSLDLTGLPPSPADVQAFVDDKDEHAYEKLVDRLIASPRWGEHRGRYWLDSARYADTHGIHFDNYREMWSYRDWVINAFNANMKFDQFTIEQLAGDLLPNPTLNQRIATGFNRCNMTTNEGGAINEEYQVLYTRDRTETTSQVWLGLTTGCAVCHDHKFDPISQKEFYQLSAFFNNTTQNAMDGNIKDTPPIIVVPEPSDRDRYYVAQSEVDGLKNELTGRKSAAKPEFDKWIGEATVEKLDSKISRANQTLRAVLADLEDKPEKSPAQSPLELDLGDFERDQSFSYGAWVKMAKPAQPGGALVARMDEGNGYRGWDLWIEQGKVGAHIINTWESDAIKVVSTEPIKPNEWTHVFVTYDGSSKAAGLKIYMNGKAQGTTTAADSLKNTIKTTVPLKVGRRSQGSPLNKSVIHDLRVYGRTLTPEDVDTLAGATRASWTVAKVADKRTPAEIESVFDWWFGTIDEPSKPIKVKIATLDAELSQFRARGTIAHVMQEKTTKPEAYILFRGDYDKRRDKVEPETPAALPALASDLPRNRLGLAQWLLKDENPLTSRVTVNRYWQEIFGMGLVRTTGDFGVTGESPSHPELLDWLAVGYRENGWDTKAFFKMLVMSATYRQSAEATPQKRETDPANRLLSRGPRFRMDAEMVRDGALSVAGLMSSKVGGPSVRPYQPEGVWEAVAMPGSNTRDYKRDAGEGLYRRSMYTFWKRAAPPASMDIFNAPSREVCTVRRERTNTPLQALVTLNDPQFVEAARGLATLVIKQGGDTNESRVDLVAQQLLARPFRAEERAVVMNSLDELYTYYQAHPEDATKLLAYGEFKADSSLEPVLLASWTMLANELMNLDEVLCK